MSSRRRSFWLGLYPTAWRARYGEELEDLLTQISAGDRISWRVRRDLLLAGAGERVRSWGLRGDGIAPETQAKAAVLLVLCGWVMFVIAGIAVQRFSEHWQDFTPVSARGLPSGAFQTLIVAALVGSVLVLAGGACALPRLLSFLRGGGWSEIRRPVIRAALASVTALGATAALVAWASRLDAVQRNGHDPIYGLGFAAGGLLVVICLGAWTAAVLTIACRLELSVRILRLEVALSTAVSVAMFVMTIATAIWWATLASRAPAALHEQSSRLASGSALVMQLLLAMTLMLIATILAGIGAACARRALADLPTAHGAG